MQKIKFFLRIFYKSILSPKYYVDVVKTPPSFSFKYFMILMLLTSTTTVLASLPGFVSPKTVVRTLDGIIDGLAVEFPDDLIVKIENGSISVNKPEPYIISLRESSDNVTELETELRSEFPKNLIVFDSNGTVKDIEEKDTLILINSKNIITRDSAGKIQTQSTAELPNGEIDKEQILKWAQTAKSYTKYVYVLIFVITVIFTLFYFILTATTNMIFLMGIAVFLLFYGSTKNLTLNFGKYFQVAIHALTLPVLLNAGYVIYFALSGGEGFVIPPQAAISILAIANLAMGIIGLNYIAENTVDKNEKTQNDLPNN